MVVFCDAIIEETEPRLEEVKSSGIGKHESITEFWKKYSKQVAKQILLSQKDVGNIEMLKLYPIYMLPFLLEDM